MKIEVDTVNDSKEDIKKVISLLNGIVSKDEFDIASQQKMQSLTDSTFQEKIVLPSKEDLAAFKNKKHDTREKYENKENMNMEDRDDFKDSDNEKKEIPKIEIY